MTFRQAQHVKGAVPAALAAVAVATALTLADGATIVVPSDQFPDLQNAITGAKPGDTIMLLPGGYGVGFEGTSLKDNLRIIGSGPSTTRISISRAEWGSVFKAKDLQGVVIEGATIVGGWGERSPWDGSPVGGGALLCIGSDVLLRNCVLANSELGGVQTYPEGDGGAIYASEGSSLTLLNCLIRDNHAEYGGAIYIFGHPSPCSLRMTGCVIESNRSTYGGAIRLLGSGEITLENCRIADNYGGGISCDRTRLTMSNCSVVDNISSAVGGGIYLFDCDFSATNCVIANNFAQDWGATNGPIGGAGIWSSVTGIVALTNCTIVRNKVQERINEDLYRRGGGLFIEGGTATIANCIFWDNTQDISVSTTAKLTVGHCDTEDMLTGPGFFHSEPKFVDPENGDFRLLGDSPCIDMGLYDPDIIPETDIEGKPRVLFGRFLDLPDLGAYEYDPSVPLQICTASLRGGIADHEYPAELKATGGFAPYSWSLISGDLPAGVSFSPEGILSGTPTAPGTYQLTFSVANLQGEAKQQSCNLDVSGYQNWYVDANAGSPGDGKSPEAPFSSIQKAADAAGVGDVVHVGPGQYSGPLTVVSPIDILGPGSEQATIDGHQKGSAISFWLLPFGKLSGFTIKNGLADKGGGLFLYESGITIENCVIESNSANYLGGGVYANLSPAKIRDCVVKNNVTGLGTYYAVQAGGGIYSYFSPLEIDRCIVENNGVKQAGYPYWGGGLTLHGSHPKLTNSLIVKNYLDSPSSYKLGAGIWALFGSPIIVNCTIADNFVEVDPFFYYRVGGLGAAECMATVRNCILWGNGVDILEAPAEFSVVGTPPEWAQGPGNINLDPQFVDPASGDYRLKDTSPCVDAGWNSYIDGYETDLSGQMRVLNGLVDMGAYENPRHEFGRLSIAKDADGLALSWTSFPGDTYVIETGTDLLRWEFVATVPSSGLYTTFLLPMEFLSPGFYRVVRVQP
jgi:hypothetical protein